jgi:hypothetical protein
VDAAEAEVEEQVEEEQVRCADAVSDAAEARGGGAGRRCEFSGGRVNVSPGGMKKTTRVLALGISPLKFYKSI